jgi:hypothetical protein
MPRTALCCAFALLLWLATAYSAAHPTRVTAISAPAASVAIAAPAAQAPAATLSLTGQLGGLTRAVALDADRTYLGVGARLRVYGGCIDPLTHLLGETEALPGVVEDVALSPDTGTVWLALGAAGVWAVDVGQPARPALGERDAVPDAVDGVPVESHRVAVDRLGRRWVSTNVGLFVVGPGGTTHLRAPTDEAPPGPVHDVAFAGAYALAAWGANGAALLHADAFDHVRTIGVIALANAQAVATTGGAGSAATAWVADGPTLRAIDVRDPVNPIALGELALDAAGGDGRAIAVRGTTVLVAFARAPAATAALAAVDGSDPKNPRLVQTERWPAVLAQLDDGTLGGLGLDVAAAGAWAIVGGDALGHRAVEIDRWLEGDRTAFTAQTTESIVPSALQLRADTPSAWLACGRGGVVPTALLGEDAAGARAYLVRAPGLVLDAPVADAAPLAPPGRPFGRYALLAAVRPRLVGLEHVPGVGEQLLLRGAITGLGHVERVGVVGDVGVTVDTPLGFAVIDIADPLAPVLSATLRVTDAAGLPVVRARDIAVDPGGKRLAAVAAGASLAMFDFSRRDQPRLVGIASSVGSAAVAWDIDRLWIATDGGDLVAYALDAVGAPQPAATTLLLPAPAEDLAIRGGTLYAALGPSGVAVVDVSGALPALKGIVETPGWASGIGIDIDGRVWVADRAAGVIVLDVPPAGPPPTTAAPTAVPLPTACPRAVVPLLWLPAAERP